MPGVELANVTKCYGPDLVIPGLSLKVEQGEFVVIVGPSGCGKSTSLRMIGGLEDVSDGRIFIRGHDVTPSPPNDRDVAMVFQTDALYPHMDVAGNMSFALQLAGRSKAEIEARVRRAAEMLELTDCLRHRPEDLSGGQRLRVAMGRSIVRDAYCFLYDEPLSHLDARLRSGMRTELAGLCRKLGRTTIYVTHDQIEAMTMADRIVVMNQGRIQQVGSPQEVYTWPCNRFVAGFIGSPAMNFLDVELINEAGILSARGHGVDLPVPDRIRERVLNSRSPQITVGLRPEHFAAAASNDPQFAPIELEVNTAGYAGSSRFLAGSVSGHPVIATVAAGPSIEPMGSQTCYFDTSRLYLFDRNTGDAL